LQELFLTAEAQKDAEERRKIKTKKQNNGKAVFLRHLFIFAVFFLRSLRISAPLR